MKKSFNVLQSDLIIKDLSIPEIFIYSAIKSDCLDLIGGNDTMFWKADLERTFPFLKQYDVTPIEVIENLQELGYIEFTGYAHTLEISLVK